MKYALTLLIVIIVIGFFLYSTIKKEKIEKVNISRSVQPIKEKKVNPEINVGIAGMISPKEGFAYYKNLIDYISEKLGNKQIIVKHGDYFTINDMLRENAIDFAFICSGPYIKGAKEFGLRLLVVPQVKGSTFYKSYIIVHKDSNVKNFQELEGKSFAFTSKLSATGYVFPNYLLAKMKRTDDNYFSKSLYTKSHDNSILAVAERYVDAAAVDSLIYDYFAISDTELISKTKIILESQNLGIPPVVVPAGIKPELEKKLMDIFLNMHNDEKARKILKNLYIDKFVLPDERIYATLRNIQEYLDRLGN